MHATPHVSVLAASTETSALESCLTRANIRFTIFESLAAVIQNGPNNSPIIIPPQSKDGAFAPTVALRLRCTAGFEVTPIIAYLPKKDVAVIKTLIGAGVDQALIEPIDPDLFSLQLQSLCRMSQTVTEELLDARFKERLPEQLGNLINAIPAPSAILDPQLAPILCNPNFAKFMTHQDQQVGALHPDLVAAIQSTLPTQEHPSSTIQFRLSAPFNQDFSGTISLLAPDTQSRLAFLTISQSEQVFTTPPYVSGLIQHIPDFTLLLTRSEERRSINALNKLLDNIESSKGTIPLEASIQSLLEVLDHTFPAELSLNIRYTVQNNLGADTATIIRILTNLVFFAGAAIQFRGDVAIQVNSSADNCRIVLRAVPDRDGVKDLSELLDTHAAEELSQVKSLVQKAGGNITADATSSAIAIEIDLPNES
jgi:hypothetical protein